MNKIKEYGLEAKRYVEENKEGIIGLAVVGFVYGVSYMAGYKIVDKIIK